MSQIREASQDPFKAYKCFVFSWEKKPCDFQSLLIRGALLIFLITSLSLFFSAYSDRSPWPFSPQCDGAADVESLVRDSINVGSESSESRTNISHIVFGMGGSVKTWPNRSRYSELWWRPNRTRGFVWLDGEPNPGVPWPETSPPYRVSEDWSRFRYSSSRSSVRIARIVKETFRLGLPNVRWFVMGDDDTVFFPENLVSVLGKYDHREMYYIGGCSESVEQDVMHSYGMAFGGGGFAVSYPLAAALAGALDGCIDRYYSFYGSDQRIWACISEIGVPLTREPGFHQIDVRGETYGLLAAHPVAPLVSLHHLDSVNPLFPSQTQLGSLSSLINAYRVDPPRIVQQTFCYSANYNFTVSVSWGYTAQIYPSKVMPKDLEKPLLTFQTWRSWANGPFVFNTRTVKADPCERPVFFFLDKVEDIGKGKSLTSYQRFGTRGKGCMRADYANAMAVDKIEVSSVKMDPRDWNKAPRRQCCEVLGKSLWRRILRVSIRKCKPQGRVTT